MIALAIINRCKVDHLQIVSLGSRDRPRIVGRHAAGTVNITQIGALAADVMAKAIVRAATEATGLPNLPAARDLPKR